MKSALACLLLLLATTVVATDLSGRWMLTLDPDFSGHPDTLYCTLKQSDSRLTADCGGDAPLSGDLTDRTVTLRFKTGEGGRVTATLTGVLNEAETTITGKWHLDSDNRDGRFEMKRR